MKENCDISSDSCIGNRVIYREWPAHHIFTYILLQRIRVMSTIKNQVFAPVISSKSQVFWENKNENHGFILYNIELLH